MTKSQKLKAALLLAAIAAVMAATKAYLNSLDAQAYSALVTNPISSLIVAAPNVVLGYMIYQLGKLLGAWKENLGKLLRCFGAFYFFGGLLVEAGCIIYFIIHLF